LAERQQIHGDKNLAPYLCNLFVSPKNRKKGLARKLIAACEDEARKWGCNCINLHVELSSAPALNLYLSCDFNIVMTAMDDVVFMTKKLSRNVLLDPPLVKL
jgi:GNAT superfamily N-acetyltransferase